MQPICNHVSQKSSVFWHFSDCSIPRRALIRIPLRFILMKGWRPIIRKIIKASEIHKCISPTESSHSTHLIVSLRSPISLVSCLQIVRKTQKQPAEYTSILFRLFSIFLTALSPFPTQTLSSLQASLSTRSKLYLHLELLL